MSGNRLSIFPEDGKSIFESYVKKSPNLAGVNLEWLLDHSVINKKGDSINIFNFNTKVKFLTEKQKNDNERNRINPKRNRHR